MVKVFMFGIGDTTVCRGCEAGNTLGELAAALEHRLQANFGENVAFTFVDIEKNENTAVQKQIDWIRKDNIDLPLTLVDGQPVYPGLFSPTMVTYAVRKRFKELGEG